MPLPRGARRPTSQSQWRSSTNGSEPAPPARFRPAAATGFADCFEETAPRVEFREFGANLREAGGTAPANAAGRPWCGCGPATRIHWFCAAVKAEPPTRRAFERRWRGPRALRRDARLWPTPARVKRQVAWGGRRSKERVVARRRDGGHLPLLPKAGSHASAPPREPPSRCRGSADGTEHRALLRPACRASGRWYPPPTPRHRKSGAMRPARGRWPPRRSPHAPGAAGWRAADRRRAARHRAAAHPREGSAAAESAPAPAPLGDARRRKARRRGRSAGR